MMDCGKSRCYRCRRCLKYVSAVFAVPLLVLLLYLAAAEIAGRIPTGGALAGERADGVDIYLHSNGVHSDIIMPLRHPLFDWTQTVHPLLPDAEYVAVGWGDRRFYLETPHWRDLTAATAWGALTGRNGSALHLIFYRRPPAENDRTVRLRVDAGQYRRLVRQVAAAFARDGRGGVLPIAGAAYAGNDAFYEANGRYHAFYTCNTWVNQTLHDSGIPAVAWTPFARHIIARYR